MISDSPLATGHWLLFTPTRSWFSYESLNIPKRYHTLSDVKSSLRFDLMNWTAATARR